MTVSKICENKFFFSFTNLPKRCTFESISQKLVAIGDFGYTRNGNKAFS